MINSNSFIRFYSRDKATFLEVQTSELEPGHYVVVDDRGEEQKNIGMDKSEQKVTRKLIDYAKVHEYYTPICLSILSKERKIQGSSQEAKVSTPIDAEQTKSLAIKYFDLLREIAEIKEERKSQIKELQDEADKLQNEITTQTMHEDVFASWEKDLTLSKMVRVRHDNKQCIAIRDMTPEESVMQGGLFDNEEDEPAADIEDGESQSEVEPSGENEEPEGLADEPEAVDMSGMSEVEDSGDIDESFLSEEEYNGE